jgi:hypothetical protein
VAERLGRADQEGAKLQHPVDQARVVAPQHVRHRSQEVHEPVELVLIELQQALRPCRDGRSLSQHLGDVGLAVSKRLRGRDRVVQSSQQVGCVPRQLSGDGADRRDVVDELVRVRSDLRRVLVELIDKLSQLRAPAVEGSADRSQVALSSLGFTAVSSR